MSRQQFQTAPPELLLPGVQRHDQAAAGEADAHSLWAVIDDRLRGRWLLMAVIGLVLSGACAWLGWRSDIPVFQSEAAIRIAPRLPYTLDRTDETGELPHFQTYVGTQVQLMKSRRVVERALKDEQLSQLAFASSPRAPIILERGIDAEADRGSQLIFVRYNAESPKDAQVVVSAVIDSYVTIWGQADSGEIGRKLDRLAEIELELQRELRQIRNDVRRIVQRHQAADLVELQNRKLEQLEELEILIESASLSLRQIEETPDGEAHAFDRINQQQLESVDPRLAELRAYRDAAESAFKNAQFRYRENSRWYVRAEEDLRMAQTHYDDRVQELLEDWDRIVAELVKQGGEATSLGLTEDQLRREIEAMEAKREELNQDSQQLLADYALLEDYELREDNTQAELERVEARRKQLEIEEPILKAGRISVVQEATLNSDVYADGRKKRAAFGGVVGFALSFGVFFLLGTVDRRTFGTAQIGGQGSADVVCLGVLPNLRRKATDRESTDVASHCVHQIRNQIEVRREPFDQYALAVTSPHQGDGKTSVVMALGWSYAAAGYDTVLVDCDLVGRSLTRQLGLVGRTGLKEAIAAGSVNGDLISLPVPHLAALPAGADPNFGPESIRKRDLMNLIEQLRGQFDMIIIDTGPLLGSLESMPVVTTADGVVVLARRGRSRSRLDEVMKRLRGVGANCLGVILNGAVRAECDRYVSEASLAASAESDRSDLVPPPDSVVRTPHGERNVLMLAMETNRPADDEEAGTPDDQAT